VVGSLAGILIGLSSAGERWISLRSTHHLRNVLKFASVRLAQLAKERLL
jgi:hypothetical protein